MFGVFLKILSSGVVSFATNKRMFKFGQELGTNYHKFMFKFKFTFVSGFLLQNFWIPFYNGYAVLNEIHWRKIGYYINYVYMFNISSMLLNSSILFKFTVFMFQISYFFKFNFQEYFVHIFFFLHQMMNFQQQMIS